MLAIALPPHRLCVRQMVAGTTPYMVPEQIQEYPRPASDQYSSGVVTYTWHSGEFPFSGSSAEIAIKHLSVPPPSIRLKCLE